MNLYILLDLLVVLFPLALSFDRKVAFFRDWPAVFPAIVAVVLVYGGWDIWKTASGVWSFNPRYSGSLTLAGLPIGEWLFFVCVPYACIFILACVRGYVRDARLPVPLRVWRSIGMLFLIAGSLAIGRVYTGVVLISVGAAFWLASILVPESLGSRNLWLALLITYIPFLLANGVLTGLPVVLYDDARNSGIRVGSIPLDDFFYSFSMLLFAFTWYDFVLRRLGPRPSVDAGRLAAGHAGLRQAQTARSEPHSGSAQAGTHHSQPGGERPGEERSGEERADSGRSRGDRSDGDRPGGDRPGGDRPFDGGGSE